MICPNCKNIVDEDRRFCPNCGCKIQISKKSARNKYILVFCISFIIVTLALCAFLFLRGDSLEQASNDVNNTISQREEVIEKEIAPLEAQKESNAEILDMINGFQKQYFEIVKRHDFFFAIETNEEVEKDSKELAQLFKEVKNKINPDNEFFVKYNEINKKFDQNTGETTVEMNEFAHNHYEAVDGLLNDVYQAVKAKLSQEDYKNLKISQKKWLKEVYDYNDVFEAQGYGTIGTIIKFDYEINMRSFRTLLLMLYL